MDYVNETFEDVTVELDGNSYDGCTFNNVLFVYGGGELTMNKCTLLRFQFRFAGPLANGLHALYQLFGTEGMLQIIRGFTQPPEGDVVELPPHDGA